MRTVVIAFVLLLGGGALAQQSPCNSQAVAKASDEIGKPGDHPELYAEDVFFFSGAYEKPFIGKSALLEGAKLRAGERKNYKAVEHRQRVVAAPSGDMAYEYGNHDVSFDDAKTGEHRAFSTAYLRVWKGVGGQCRVAAMTAQPLASQKR